MTISPDRVDLIDLIDLGLCKNRCETTIDRVPPIGVGAVGKECAAATVEGTRGGKGRFVSGRRTIRIVAEALPIWAAEQNQDLRRNNHGNATPGPTVCRL